MEKVRLALIFLNLASCYGLEFALNRQNQDAETIRNVCGVLTCREHINPPHSTLDDNLEDPKVFLKNITSLSVFKRSGNSQSAQDVLFGSVTSESPNLSLVSNGRKVNGFLEQDQAELTVELVQPGDCFSDFVCQVRGQDSKGREAVSTTNLVHHNNQGGSQMLFGSSTSAASIALVSSIQQIIMQSVNNLDKGLDNKMLALSQSVSNLENKMEARMSTFTQMINNLETRMSGTTTTSGQRLEDKMSQHQNNLYFKMDSFESHWTNMINEFKDSVAEKLSENKFHQLSKSDDLESFMNKHKQFHTETNSEPFEAFYNLTERSRLVQEEALQNISVTLQDNFRRTSERLVSMEEDLTAFRDSTEKHLGFLRNETRVIKNLLASGRNSSLCVQSKTEDKVTETLNADECVRGMAHNAKKSFLPYEKVVDDKFLMRDLLCDTHTDGGGWIVIQRRKKGKLDFFRTWNDYKQGFGNLSTDFWLGNEAIHYLTSNNDYELRLDLVTNEGVFYSEYSSFKIGAESDKYRLHLGSSTGSIGEITNYGMSYHDGQPFSTYDQDNEADSRNCAQEYHGAWWYKGCYRANLNGKWDETKEQGMKLYSGSQTYYLASTEMKIRRI